MKYESYASLEQGIRILRVPLKCLFCIHIYEFSDPFSFLYHITSTIIAIKVCPFYNVERICASRLDLHQIQFKYFLPFIIIQ